jgi:hypothetical protein
LGTIGDKEGAFKSVILRDAVSATENLNAHYSLYLRPHYARPRTKTKRAALASNPTPSAILILSIRNVNNAHCSGQDELSFIIHARRRNVTISEAMEQAFGLTRKK